MSFPREENLADLVGKRPYSDGVVWRVYQDLDGQDVDSLHVLVILDQGWTAISVAEFKDAAERILRLVS